MASDFEKLLKMQLNLDFPELADPNRNFNDERLGQGVIGIGQIPQQPLNSVAAQYVEARRDDLVDRQIDANTAIIEIQKNPNLSATRALHGITALLLVGRDRGEFALSPPNPNDPTYSKYVSAGRYAVEAFLRAGRYNMAPGAARIAAENGPDLRVGMRLVRLGLMQLDTAGIIDASLPRTAP